jgi:hypothetical protein
LIAVTAVSVTGTETYDTSNVSVNTFIDHTTNRDIWDVQFYYDAGTPSGSLYLAGAEFDGTNFYCPEWNSANIHYFDAAGNYLGVFTIPGVSSVRDLAYDGTYFYGGSASTTIYEMDLEAQTLISTISTTASVRSIAYDEDNDAFWVNNFGDGLSLVDRTGAVIDTMANPESMYGSAWDDISQISGYDGPFLWITTGTSTGSDLILKVVDLATKTLIPGISHNVAQELGTGISGGLFLTTDFISGTATLGGMCQGDPQDYLYGYEIAITNSPPLIPDAPDGPDTGATGVEYTFTASTTDPEDEDVYYKFDWGNGVISDWFGPYASGATGEGSYTWTAAGTFDVKVKAKDVNGGESGWSAAHSIDIAEGPIMDIRPITGGLFKITATIKNAGAVEATDVAWSITLEGGAFIGKETTGTIAIIPPGGSVDVKSGFIIGLGKTTITVTADVSPGVSDIREQSGTILLFFIKVNPGGG